MFIYKVYLVKGSRFSGCPILLPKIGWGKEQVKKMYIDADVIIKAASLLAALGALFGAAIAVYKVLENNKKQNEVIKSMQEEQTIICYGLKGALAGLIEHGCDGPCEDALKMLDKHLNKSAHKPDL